MTVGPLIDDTDFKSREAPAWNAAGMDAVLHEETQASKGTTALTLTSGGAQDWVADSEGYATVEVTAAQLDTEGNAWIGGVCDGVLPFESPHYDVADLTDATALSAFLGTLSSGALTTSSFAAGAINAAAIADAAIDAATFAADVDAEILGYIVDDATQIDASALNTASTAIGSDGTGLTEAGGDGDHLTEAGGTGDQFTGTVNSILGAALTESYATDGSTATLTQLLYMIWSMLAERSVSSTTVTAKQLDGSTTSMTFTLDSASSPTSITRAS